MKYDKIEDRPYQNKFPWKFPWKFPQKFPWKFPCKKFYWQIFYWRLCGAGLIVSISLPLFPQAPLKNRLQSQRSAQEERQYRSQIEADLYNWQLDDGNEWLPDERPYLAQAALKDQEPVNQKKKEKPFYIPDYLKQHTGSYQGLVALGAGYAFFSALWELDILYNYSPASVAGREIHSLSVRNSINPYVFKVEDFEITPLYLGSFFVFAFHKELDYILPSDYPNSYYPPTAFHYGLHGGFEIAWLKKFSWFKKASFSIEYAIHDVAISAYFNESHLKIEEVISWGFGFKFYLQDFWQKRKGKK